ncbi:MAG: FAD-binding protein, partial [Oscillospiraceae bacterium]|nr:FAD-binding protein [Oscillospiraceae bacterium]
MMQPVNIIGAGLAGLSAAITLASHKMPCRLISLGHSERAQSVLAEGGINAALNTMGEGDTPTNHFIDTMRGGCELADPKAVEDLTTHAPEILRWLEHLGVPFNRTDTDIMLRNFGGQKLKRTAYARSSTGKILMTAVIDEARSYEAKGLITRYPHHAFLQLMTDKRACQGVIVQDTYSGEVLRFPGITILCSGGLNGMFPGWTTGTTQNTADVTAAAFAQGVRLANLEMLQYHPTTFGISGKRCLVTEAARGEGGRLCIERDGTLWYFMEELHPALGNLSPRDVVARTMYFVRRQSDTGDQVYLDLTGLSREIWEKRLSDLRQELMHYLGLDPRKKLIPVQEGIHYFMGGIAVDPDHRTSMANLYAAGECACQYHGANRLGGNSLLGALYGGRRAAETILQSSIPELQDIQQTNICTETVSPLLTEQIRDVLLSGLGIVRSEDSLTKALYALQNLTAQNEYEQNRLYLAEAMLRSALVRKESRGAHYREDFPETSDAFRCITAAECTDGKVKITCRGLEHA